MGLNRTDFDLHTVNEVAVLIERDPKTVRAYFNAGIIKGRRLKEGGRIYFHRKDIENYFKGKQNAKPTKRNSRQNNRRSR